jgi:hypothetical protein
MNFDNFFSDLNDEISETWAKASQPSSDEQYFIHTLDDIEEYASDITGHWNGKESGSQEDRAHCADDIITKVQELKELLSELEEL